MRAIEDIDRGFAAFAANMRRAAKESGGVKVGVFDTFGREDGKSNVELAAIQEFGSPSAGIPERSFLRATADSNRFKYVALEKRLMKLVTEGKSTVPQALNLLGAKGAADVKAWIVAQRGFAPLAASTIAEREARGMVGTKALIATSQMINSIAWQVVPGAEP